MKTHTDEFKEQIRTYGKQLSSIITYKQDNKTIKLGASELNSITPHYKTQILKSVMKQLDIDSNVRIPEGTEVNYKFGVRVRDEETDDETANYDYIDFGNYIVNKVERQEDSDSYSIVCYDKMLWSMVPYEKFVDKYPIIIRDYIDKLANKIGLEFANKTDKFTNYDKEIPAELYLTDEGKDNGYRYRDVLDELSEVVGGNIIIDKDDKLAIKYITETNDTIDERYFQSEKVNTGKNYGPINSIVLSRSAESDNIYLRDEDSVKANGLCEIKIKDNQIMNFNNRDEFLKGLLKRLNGIEFYLNDYSLTGVCYYDVCDRYSVKIGKNIYSCVMFEDEVDVTQGIEEQITTEEPEKAETDYSKADKTDRRINQTNLIVNKQQQTINGLIKDSSDKQEQIVEINASLDQINTKVDNKVDITEDKNSNNARIVFTNINQGPPVEIRIRPTSNDISYLYPSKNLYPSKLTYLKIRDLVFTNTKTNEVFRYTLPMDLWYLDENTYDEFILNYPNQECKIIQRVDWNNNQDKYKLDKEVIHTFDFPNLNLTEGDYEISLPGYDSAYMYIKLMIQNEYTKRFATKVELNSSITQLDNEINLKVEGLYSDAKKEIDKKADDEEVKDRFKTVDDNIKAQLALKVDKDDNDQIVSMINASANIIHLKSNRFIVDSDNLNIEENGKLTCTAGEIGNMKIEKNSFYLPITTNNKLSRDEIVKVMKIVTGQYTPTEEEKKKLDNNGDGKISPSDAVLAVQKGGTFNITEANPGRISFVSDTYKSAMVLYGGDDIAYNRFGLEGIEINTIPLPKLYSFNGKYQGNNYTLSGEETTSKLEIGKNIVKNLSCFGNYNDSEEYKSNPYLEYSLDNDKKEAELIISNGIISAGYYPSGIDIVSSEYEARYFKNSIELTNKQTNYVITIANDTIKIIDNNTKQEAEMNISPNGANIRLYQDDKNYTTIFPGGINLVLNGQAKIIQGDN